MLVLALDASLGSASAAVVDTAGDIAVARHDEGPEGGRAERLPKLVADLLAAAAVPAAAISRVVVTTGPGGFTGVRVGVAFARGFALVHRIPVVGVDTLTALALAAEASAGPRPVLAAVQGRGGRLLARVFGPGAVPLGETTEIGADAVAAAVPVGGVLAGPAAANVAPEDRPLAAARVEPIALARFGAGLDPAAFPPTPRYAAPPDAIRPAPSGLVAPTVPARTDMPKRPGPRGPAGAEQ